MIDIKLEVGTNVDKSVMFQERKPVLENNSTLTWNHVVNTQISTLDNVNSVSSIQKDNLNYINIEKLNEDHHVIALERQVYTFISAGRTKEAKELLEKSVQYSSPLIDKWKKAFSILSTKNNNIASLQKNEIENESKWIRKNSKYFVSKWVALIAGDLVASNDRLEDLKQDVESINRGGNVTFLKL
jgi:hypothetical protein